MAYWKYHIESGDALQFWHEDEDGHRRLYWGTLTGIFLPDDYDEDEIESYDDLDLSEFDVKIKSGREEVTVNLDEDVKKRVKEDERETDLPLMSERLRFSGGVGQKS